MLGNVWEWCNDWFDEKEYKNRKDGVKDPQGIQTGTYRVLRGASFGNFRYYARCASRGVNLPLLRYDRIGFRVCASSPSLI
jgi:sulfatase modifying factor 1